MLSVWGRHFSENRQHICYGFKHSQAVESCFHMVMTGFVLCVGMNELWRGEVTPLQGWKMI